MKFTTECSELQKHLSTLFKGRGSILRRKPQTHHLKIEATTDNRAIFEFYNQSFAIYAKVDIPGAILLYPQGFVQLMLTFKSGPITFEANNSILTLLQDNTKFSLSYVAKEGEELYRERYVHDKDIYYRRLIQEKEKELFELKKRVGINNDTIIAHKEIIPPQEAQQISTKFKLSSLTDEEQTILENEVNGIPYQDTAKELCIPIQSIKNILKRLTRNQDVMNEFNKAIKNHYKKCNSEGGMKQFRISRR